jgi:hypothetical protein
LASVKEISDLVGSFKGKKSEELTEKPE